jgi:RNA polymerase sigma-70 factor (ECF subfamily)
MLQVGRGSRQAFVAIVERHQDDLYRFFRLLGADRHRAEDGVQETFLRLYLYRDRYRPLIPLRVFLHTLARNVWKDALRRERRRVKLAPSSDPREDGPLDCVPLATDLFRRIDDRLDLSAAVQALPGRLRAAVILSAYQGLSYPEIAVVLGIPLGTVKTRMYHAFRKLRQTLDTHVANRR